MNLIRKTMLLGPMLLAAGCMKTTITTGAPAGAASDHKARFFLYGLIGETDFNLDQMCPTGVSFINGLATYGVGLIGLPAIVYNPGTVKVWCKSGSAFKAEFSEQGELLSMTQVD